VGCLKGTLCILTSDRHSVEAFVLIIRSDGLVFVESWLQRNHSSIGR
jgi:hypothetical protein